jgi:hypothetical protein
MKKKKVYDVEFVMSYKGHMRVLASSEEEATKGLGEFSKEALETFLGDKATPEVVKVTRDTEDLEYDFDTFEDWEDIDDEDLPNIVGR